MIRHGGLICSLKSFLQLNMCQELQIFAVVYMYLVTSYVLLDFVIVTLELLQQVILLSGSFVMPFAST